MSIRPDADSFIFIDHRPAKGLAVDPSNPNAEHGSAKTPGPDDSLDDGLLLPAVQDHGLLLPAVQDEGLLLPAVQDHGLLLPAVQVWGLLLPY